MEQGIGKSDLARQAEALAKDCAAFAEQLRQERSCQEVILEVMNLAMIHRSLLRIYVNYYPKENTFTARVYSGKHGSVLFQSSVNLEENNDCLEQLLNIEDAVIELIAQARDEMEGKA